MRKIVNLYGRSDFMTIQFDREKIKQLMEAFYITSGIRFVLFDSDYREIISFPKEKSQFCSIIRSCPAAKRKCTLTDRKSFKKCEKEQGLVIYKCHAGLVEATVPLYENQKIIGYLMLGQITDYENKEKLYALAETIAKKHSLDSVKLRNSVSKITYKTAEEISAAAKIMEACTSYIYLKELVLPENNRIIEAGKKYIAENLSTPLDINKMCNELGVGRTKLYELCRRHLNMGVAEYVKQQRLHEGKKLLKTTDLPIKEIAERIGFADYNYFSRVFKKHYGKSPKSYRR